MSVSDALSLGTVPEGASVEASEDSRTVTLTIPLSQGQSLLAEYRLSDGQLISSRIFNSEDYASTRGCLYGQGRREQKQRQSNLPKQLLSKEVHYGY